MRNPLVNWKLLLLEGVVLILIGLFALANPFLMSLSLEILLGSVLIVAGLVQGYRALMTLKNPDSVIHLISAAFALIAGLLLFAYPLTGVLTLALLLTIYFFSDGFIKIIGGIQLRPLKGAGWIIFSGIISLILGIMIISGFPTTALWVIGIYLGVYLLFLGVSLVTLAMYTKKGVA